MAICIWARCWWRNGDVYIIDFEGEPAKPMAVRRAQESPAARCRGHDPLVRLCGRGGEAEECRQPGACRRPEPRRIPADVRRAGATQSFLAGYQEAVPRAKDDAQRERDLLQLFLIEKAAYEIAYEAANRPGLDRCAAAWHWRNSTRQHSGGQFMNDIVDLASPAARDRQKRLPMARLRDPFGVLGPHDTSAGRIVRAFPAGAMAVEVSRAR